MPLPDCKLNDTGELSKAFLLLGAETFSDACAYVKSLPYGRNEDKRDAFALFKDKQGTCSTKHAALKRVADENGLNEVELITGMYKMNGMNTPGTAKVLWYYKLEYIPEAHNYLKVGGERFDFTFPRSEAAVFENDLLEETAIQPHQVTDYKVALHKNFLSRWLESNKEINLTLSRLWEIREECIAALSQNRES